jgi:hypothetical protein
MWVTRQPASVNLRKAYLLLWTSKDRQGAGGDMIPMAGQDQHGLATGIPAGSFTLPSDLGEDFSWLLSAFTGNLPKFAAGFSPRRLASLRYHRLTPWLYHEIMQHHWEVYLPPEALATLRHDYALNFQATLRDEREISRVLQTIAGAGMEIIVLKGAELRYRLYNDPAVRLLSDLDLLVPPDAVRRIETLVLGLGYHLYLEHQLRPDDWIGVGNELTYNPPSPLGLYLDLHWEITSILHYYRLPYAPLRRDAVPLNLYGVPAYALSPEHTLLNHCLQACEDFPRLDLLLDMVAILTTLPCSWPKFLQETERFQCQRPVFSMLQLIAHFLPQMVPDAVLTQLARYQPSLAELAVLHPGWRYLTMGLPSFWRHRNLRRWLILIKTDLWPPTDRLTAAYGKPDRRTNLRRVLTKLHDKVFSTSRR